MSFGGEANDAPEPSTDPLEADVSTGANRSPDPVVNADRLQEVLDLAGELPTRRPADTIETVPFHKQVKEQPDNG